MKTIKTLVKTFTLAVATLALPFAATAAGGDGNIFSIHPLDKPLAEGGAILSPTTMSAAPTLKGGDTVRFVVRLQKNDPGSNPFRLVYTGLGSEPVDMVLNPPQVGVFVSGKLRMAKLEGSPTPAAGGAGNYTDFVFAYQVKPGDFELPVRLADKDGNVIKDASEVKEYYFYLGPKDYPTWAINDSTGTATTGTDANLWFTSEPGRFTPPADGCDAYIDNYDFTKYPFKVQTVDFDANGESAEFWRTVHEGSVQTGGARPSLHVEGLPTNSVTLYVWSMNEAAVKVVGETKQITVANGVKEPRQVATVKVVAGEQDYPFDIEGVAQGGEAELVLSAFEDFQYGKVGSTDPVRLSDYATVKVKCTEPLPASVKLAVTPAKVMATSESGALSVSVVELSLTEKSSTPVEIEIKPGFTAASGESWSDYIRFSEIANEDVTLQKAPYANPVLVFPAESLKPAQLKNGAAVATLTDGKLYVYTLRGDAWSDSTTGTLVFDLDADAAVKAAYEGFDKRTALTVTAQDPVIESMFDGKDKTSAVADAECQLKIAVSDTYADLHSDAGYEIWVKRDVTKGDFEAIKDEHGATLKFKPGKGGVLYLVGTTDKLPTVKYSQDGTFTSAAYVKAPVSGNQSAEHQYEVTVTIPAGYSVETLTGEDTFDEGTEVQLRIRLDEKNSQGDIYAYLKGETATDDEAISCIWKAAAGGKGVKLQNFEQELAGAKVKFTLIDGTGTSTTDTGKAGKGGATYSYEVVFLTQATWTDDASKRVNAYRSKNPLVVTSYNLMPSVEVVSAANGLYDVDEDKMHLPGKFPANVAQEFSVTVNEPGDLDKTTTKPGEEFQVRWFFQSPYGDKSGPVEAPTDGIVKGDPDTTSCHYTFTAEGTYTITCEVRDKDMTKWENTRKFTFYMDVVKNPAITIETRSPYSETSSTDAGAEGDDATFAVNLGLNNCDFDMEVELTVEPNGTSAAPGTFVLLDGGNVTAMGGNVYKVKFPARQTTQTVWIKQLDGTLESSTAGFKITPKMLTEDIVPNSGGQKASDYYLGVAATQVKVKNEKPYIDETLLNPPPTVTNNVSIGMADEALTWSFTDVELDFTRGVTVEIKGGGGRAPKTFNTLADAIADGATGFKPTFTQSGDGQTVKLIVTDPDNGVSTVTWLYNVAASKTMKLIAHGPTTGFGGNNGDRYTSKAKGIGEGRVWSVSKSAISVDFWTSVINCGTEKDATIYGYGYKVGDVDGSHLAEDGMTVLPAVFHYPDGVRTGYYADRDTPINAEGDNLATGATDAYAYKAPKDDLGLGRDSFLYLWLAIGADGKGSADADAVLGGRITPELSEAKDSGRPATLPDKKDDNGSFAVTKYEAVFALEKYWSDNMGDINLDGIPDAYAKFFGFGVFGDDGSFTGDDLADLSEFNEDEDYLPGTDTSAYGAYIPGATEDWAKDGKKFTALMELRGYDVNLNDAPVQAGITGVKPDRRYEMDDGEGNMVWSNACSISELEYFAWKTSGLDADKWSPERPTDPTKADTDDDGLPDGYEYYFWYRAFVGDLEYFTAKETKGKYRRLEGHRYNPLRPDSGDLIPWNKIAEAFDPRSDIAGKVLSKADMEIRDLDNDGIPDVLEFQLGTNPIEWDTDGDGLPDGYEVMHGFDPLKAETVQGTRDGASNPDGDWMAAFDIPMTILPVPRANPLDPECGRCDYYAVPAKLTKWTTENPEGMFKEQGHEGGWYFQDDAEAEYVYCGEGNPFVVKDGVHYLDQDLTYKDVFKTQLMDPDRPTFAFRGEGVQLTKGLKLHAAPIAIAAGNGVEQWVEYLLNPDLSGDPNWAILGNDKDFSKRGYTAWRYGKTGKWSLGANVSLKGGADGNVVCPVGLLDNATVRLMHHQVYQWRGFMLSPAEAEKYGTLVKGKDFGTGFNPNTGWFKNKAGLVNGRWTTFSMDPSADWTKARANLHRASALQMPGHAVDTEAFTTADEFLLMTFWANCGVVANPAKDFLATPPSKTMLDIWKEFTTIPTGGAVAAAPTAGGTNDVNTAAAPAAGGGNHGADSDGDGVPDGWELYVAHGIGTDENTFALNIGAYSPLNDKDATRDGDFDLVTGRVGNNSIPDGLSLVSEFCGTDSMLAYADVASVPTEHPFNKRWLNKFWPTDPWSYDTDGDGICDGQEGQGSDDQEGGVIVHNLTDGVCVYNFVYGAPTDDGSRCIAGGGMNPCSMDTDRDGLPDLWEGQHEPDAPAYSHHGEWNGEAFGGGMDATVPDSYTKRGGPNRDYDCDGLQNWQEYLTGTIRAFRYDDAFSPWTVPQWLEATGTDAFFKDALVASANPIDPLDPKGGSNPNLVFGKFDSIAAYGTVCRRGWDAGCGFVYFFPDGPNHVLRQGSFIPGDPCLYGQVVKKAGFDGKVKQLSGPTMYATTSPRSADSDNDGMDDFYELFHGLDPLYGGTDGRDLVALRWKAANKDNDVSAKNNYWTYALKAQARGDGDEAKLYDFTVYPWMAGDPMADPDGDDVRNYEEAIQANAQATVTWKHTDPTPQWMTDPADPNSLVSRYYGVPFLMDDGKLSDQYPGAVPAKAGDVELPQVRRLNAHRWGVFSTWRVRDLVVSRGYDYAFEKNEGYDSDHDGLGDNYEATAVAGTASDPRDTDDPVRRQAMWFDGKKSAVQAPNDPVIGGSGELYFLEFTAECWVKPETNCAQTILERVIRHPRSNPNDKVFYRRNFKLGIDESGFYYAAFDDDGTTDKGQVRAVSQLKASDAWTHLAATFDGTALRLYINGVQMASRDGLGSHPATSSTAVKTVVTGTNGTVVTTAQLSDRSAIIIGAAAKENEDDNGLLLIPEASSWLKGYEEFYKGYVDEVRLWDGARTLDEIKKAYTARFTAEDAQDNRDLVYAAWKTGARRNLAGAAKPPAELMYLYNFAGLFTALDAKSLAQVPYGYATDLDNGGKALCVRPVGWTAPEWKKLLTHSLAYKDYSYVPWIVNVVGHLPAYDGTTADSVFWSATHTGAAPAANAFPRNRELFGAGRAVQQDLADNDATFLAVNAGDAEALLRHAFAKRLADLGGTDALPLGNAFVKIATNFWDNNGPTSLADTEIDQNFNNLPDWWEKAIVDPSVEGSGFTLPNGDPIPTDAYGLAIDANTLIKGPDGVVRTASEWYRIHLAKGAHDGTPPVLGDEAYAQSADRDNDNIPDWWEELYGVQGNSKDDGEKDPDHDGLSNYAEYLISEVEKLHGLNPLRARSYGDNETVDYFLQVPEGKENAGLYLGEVFADHDFMEDELEREFGTDPNKYDAYSDADGDGWTAFSEIRYSTFKKSGSLNRLSHFVGNIEVGDYPVPVIRTTLRYNGASELTGSNAMIVVEAYSGNDLQKKPNAVFKVTGESGADRFFYIGPYTENVIHGTLAPGYVSRGLDAISIQVAHVQDNDRWSWSLNGQIFSGTYKEMQAAYKANVGNTNFVIAAESFDFTDLVNPRDQGRQSLQVTVEDATQKGTLELDRETAGEIDLSSGDFTLSLAALRDHYMADSKLSLQQMFFRIRYTTMLPAMQSRAMTVSLAEPNSGALKEGVTAFRAYMDFDGDGFTPGKDPVGYVKGVDVGWDKVPDLVIEMTDSTAAGERFACPDGAERVRIFRTKVNGVDIERKRVVFNRDMTKAERMDFYEADFQNGQPFGLDGKMLHNFLVDPNSGYDISNVTEVTYMIMAGDAATAFNESNVVKTFSIKYAGKMAKPSAVSPSALREPVVAAARPTFKWTGPSDCTAFRFQVKRISEDGSETNDVYASDTLVLPPRDLNGAFTWQPPVYVATNVCGDAWALENNCTGYVWRVAMYNAKYNDTTDEASVWSDWAAFTTAVAEKNDRTGNFGTAKVDVRYFGPYTDDVSLSNVVVQLYRNADFTGVPAAQTRLAFVDGAVTNLSNEAGVALFGGIESGDWYAVAFVDRNGNGTREGFETWGYLNQVGEGVSALYTPVALKVDATSAETAKGVIYLEDTDIQPDKIPDCLQPLADLEKAWRFIKPNLNVEETDDPEGDPDGDGLVNRLEEEYGTDPDDADTDKDGLPDGWEVENGTDPLNADSDMAIEYDVMAYAETAVHAWAVTNAQGEATWYVMKGGSNDVHKTENVLYTTFKVDNDERLYVGAPTNLPADVKFAYDTISTNAVLMHSAVYDWYGFNPNTARPAEDDGSGTNKVGGVNTKLFTVLDKYLTAKYYLPQFGVTDCTSLKYGIIDGNANGIADGWELYVAFATVKEGNKPFSTKFPVEGDELATLKAAYDHNNVKGVAYDPHDDLFFYRQALEGGLLAEGDLRLVQPYDNLFAISNEIQNADAAALEAFFGYAPAGDVFAIREGEELVAVSNGVEYVVNPTNFVLYATTNVNGQLVVTEPTTMTWTNLTDKTGWYSASTNVVVMHAAVYDFYGWDPTTAQPAAGEGTNAVAGVDTATFTRLWKYLTDLVYLPAVTNGTEGYELKSWKTDSNANRIPDGYELYVRFAAATNDIAFTDELAQIAYEHKVDPYESDWDYDGLPNGWEIAYGADGEERVLDPFTPDADTWDGSVMAYAEVSNGFMRVENGVSNTYYAAYVTLAGDSNTFYVAVSKGELAGTILGGRSDVTYYNTFVYGALTSNQMTNVAIGRPFTTNVAASVRSPATFLALHASVYDLFGYNYETANAIFDGAMRWSSLSNLVTAVGEVGGVNTKKMTAMDKYLLADYLAAVGYCSADDIDGESADKRWAYTLEQGRIDHDGDGLADGWELYMMFGTNTVWSKANAKLSPFAAQTADLMLDGESTVVEKMAWGLDPYNKYSAFETAYVDEKAEKAFIDSYGRKYTDREALDYRLIGRNGLVADPKTLTLENDEDMDGLRNYQEWLAKHDLELTLCVTNVFSGGSTTQDYFRVGTTSTKYVGEFYNGAEWIEGESREALGIDVYNRIGTRDVADRELKGADGWDYWSEARMAEIGTNGVEFASNAVANVALTLKYEGNESKAVVVEAYQVSSAYPEKGEQLTAKWNVAADFKAGVAKVTLGAADVGALVQGPARFVAYIDADGDGKFSPADTFAEAEKVIGFAGCELVMTLGDYNPALPFIEIATSNATDVVNGIAIVRTAVNGKKLEKPRGVWYRYVRNNVDRDMVYPSEFVSDDYIGVDKFLGETVKAFGTTNVTSVTYEVLVGTRPFCISNLNEFVQTTIVTNGTDVTTNKTWVQTGAANKTFTLTYSDLRDVPTVRASAENTADKVIVSFDLPNDREQFRYTRFWLKVDGIVKGGEKGYLLPNDADGLVTIDLKDYKDVALTVGKHTVAVALGNDKYGKPTDAADFSETIDFAVNAEAAFDGKIRVKVAHPAVAEADYTTDNGLSNGFVVAVYKTADLANPVAFGYATNNVAIGALDTYTAEIGNLNSNESYYVAAWNVKNAWDGRKDVNGFVTRLPYDSWGYVTAFGEEAACFTPGLVKATNALVKVWIQDTDWNVNSKLDREEDFYVNEGVTVTNAVDFFADFDLDGIPDIFDDDPLPEDIVGYGTMAYFDTNVLFVAVGEDSIATNWTWYAVMDIMNEPKLRDSDIPLQTKASDLTSLMSIWDMGNAIGVGTNVTFTGDTLKVWATEYGTARLIHAQVYAALGYDARTANTQAYLAGEAVNTKPFSKTDRYMVLRYLENIGTGIREEDWVKPQYKHAEVWNLVWCDQVNPLMPVDTDFDDVDDGWELYTMFGPNDVSALSVVDGKFVTNASISPWNTADGMALAPGAGSALKLVEEFDGGYLPTDPWALETKSLALDGLSDEDAYKYGLKTRADQLADYDHDGLSNWAEYLATKAGYGTFDPFYAFSANDEVMDYFVKVTSGDFTGWYVGEALVADGATADFDARSGYHMIADHDFVEDWWEYENGANPYVYDSIFDEDQNGWDNWSTVRASMDPDVIMEDKITKRRHTFIDLNAAQYEAIINDGATYEIVEDTMQITAREEGDIATGKLVVNIKTVEKVPRAYPTPKVDLTLTFPRNFVAAGVSNDVIATLSAYTQQGAADCTWSVKLSNLDIAKGILTTQLRKSDVGNLRQGLNTFVVKADGGFIGYARDVDVGWDEVTDLRIGLSTESAAFPIFSVSSSNATERLRIVRTQINGKQINRTVWKSGKGRDGKYVTSGTFTEVDLIDGWTRELDFDWNHLLEDAAYLGIKVEDIDTASYAVMSGTNVLYTYEKAFAAKRTQATLVSPIWDKGEKLVEARPTFTWKGALDTTAFELQLSADSAFDPEKTLVVRDFLPAATEDGRSYSPTWYVGEELEDATKYYWRVAELNAKWQTADGNWSEVGEFTTAVNSVNANTGMGKVAAEVRYYGPATNALDNVVVAAYRTADFTGAPAARVRLSGEGCVTNLAAEVGSTNFLVAATNVVLDGLKPGRYYVMAFIDANTNDVREAYESWGYVCKIGTAAQDTWSPVALRSVSNKADVPSAVLIMEDTDVNRDFWPDCLDDMSGWKKDDPPEFESDWEDVFGTEAVDDQMAYADLDVLFVDIGVDRANVTRYAVMDLANEGMKLRDSDIALGVDASKLTSLATVWAMDDYVGVGTNVAFKAADGLKVWFAEPGKVRLVHAQVYAQFGYETGCAVTEGAVHTKPFTARDKYLVCRYLENIGVADANESNLVARVVEALRTAWENHTVTNTRPIWLEYTLDPNELDGDRDDVSDGWELYTMFGTQGLTAFMGCPAVDRLQDHDKIRISPFWGEDGLKPAPAWDNMGEVALKLVEEFDGGYLPTDPWSADTDRDGVIDTYAYRYHLKGDDSREDLDGDGLSNYAEYLVSEVFRFAKLDPENPKTDGYCVDYFRKMGDLYLGEVFTDHDQVEDVWEDAYPTHANRDLYDPNRDDDSDGWSNYAEFRAGTDPTTIVSSGIDNYTLAEYPVPVIEANVVYNGTAGIGGKLVFKAWSEKADTAMLAQPDAVWNSGSGTSGSDGAAVSGTGDASKPVEHVKYVGRTPKGVRTFNLGPGRVNEGSVKLGFKDRSFWVVDQADWKDQSKWKLGNPDDARWFYGTVDNRVGSGNVGVVMTMGGQLGGAVQVGTIDYNTGKLTIDFENEFFRGYMLGMVDNAQEKSDGTGEKTPESGTYDLLNLDESYMYIQWTSVNIASSAAGTYFLSDSDSVGSDDVKKGLGHVREGKNTFVCYVADANGAYVPGAPYGVVRGVDVGWQGASFTVELKETSPITERLTLWGEAKNDRSATIDGTLSVFINDHTIGSALALAKAQGVVSNEAQYVEYEAMVREALANRCVVEPASEGADKVRVRVVRYGIDDTFAYLAGVGSPNGSYRDQLVVLEKEFDRNGRDYLCEADFLGDGKFDIDWGTLSGTDFRDGAVVDASGNPLGTGTTGPLGAGCDVTNMTYLVVLGDGPKDFANSDDTNTTVRIAGTISRRFDRSWQPPRCEGVIGGGDLTPAGTVYTAHPTFVWSMPTESAWAKRFGSSYTAFKLRIVDADGALVYESDVTRAPKQDANGRFVWTAPISVGGQTPQGKIFANNASYTWRVAMFNAKFQPNGSVQWAAGASFSTAVNAQQSQNDAGFSSVGVTVKYTGPAKVLYDRDANAWLSDDLTAVKGKVRVQAFDTADFCGVPACETVVADHVSLADVTDVFTNAVLKGLAAGTYFIRAYIDSNGNFVKDDFESWGYAKEPVTVGPDVIRLPAVSLYIEDADTNGNWYPDAWEYQYLNKGKLSWEEIAGQKAAAPRKDGEIVLAKAVYDQMVGGVAGFSSGLLGSKVTIFQDEMYAELLLDPNGDWDDTVTTTFDAIRNAVKKNVVDKTLKITAIQLDTANSQVVLTMDADVDYANVVSGNLATRLYDLDAMNIGSECTVKVLVFKKESLAQADWKQVGEFTKTFGKGAVSVEVDVTDNGDKIDTTSGFYMIKVVQ